MPSPPHFRCLDLSQALQHTETCWCVSGGAAETYWCVSGGRQRHTGVYLEGGRDILVCLWRAAETCWCVSGGAAETCWCVSGGRQRHTGVYLEGRQRHAGVSLEGSRDILVCIWRGGRDMLVCVWRAAETQTGVQGRSSSGYNVLELLCSDRTIKSKLM